MEKRYVLTGSELYIADNSVKQLAIVGHQRIGDSNLPSDGGLRGK